MFSYMEIFFLKTHLLSLNSFLNDSDFTNIGVRNAEELILEEDKN